VSENVLLILRITMLDGVPIRFLIFAALSAIAGSQTVHYIYQPLQELKDYKADLAQKRKDILRQYLEEKKH